MYTIVSLYVARFAGVTAWAPVNGDGSVVNSLGVTEAERTSPGSLATSNEQRLSRISMVGP